MKLSDFIWMPYSDRRYDYRAHIAKAAIDENWGQDYRYMYDYIRDNFEIAYKQGKVKEHPERKYCLFRAGTLVIARESRLPSWASRINNLAGNRTCTKPSSFGRGSVSGSGTTSSRRPHRLFQNTRLRPTSPLQAGLQLLALFGRP